MVSVRNDTVHMKGLKDLRVEVISDVIRLALLKVTHSLEASKAWLTQETHVAIQSQLSLKGRQLVALSLKEPTGSGMLPWEAIMEGQTPIVDITIDACWRKKLDTRLKVEIQMKFRTWNALHTSTNQKTMINI